MKTKFLLLFVLSLFTVISCSKDETEEAPTITIETPETEAEVTTPEFVEGINPNLNDGTITFEEDGRSFNDEDRQPDDRSTGNWSRFGGVDETNLTVAYSENPGSNSVNNSGRVIKVTEPVGVDRKSVV